MRRVPFGTVLAVSFLVVALGGLGLAAPAWATNVSGHITSNTTWTASGSPYVLTDVVVDSGVTLTIDPGVVVKMNRFSSAQLLINGSLHAAGTTGDGIVFTSLWDDAADGVDSDGGGATGGQIGDWQAIEFANAGSSTLSHVAVRYGGYDSSELLVDAGASLTISDSTVEQSTCSGISAGLNARLIVTRVNVRGNGVGDGETGPCGSGILSDGAYTTISDSVVSANVSDGVTFSVTSAYSAGSAPSLDNSLIWQNAGLGVNLLFGFGAPTAAEPSGHENDIFDNQRGATSPAMAQLGADGVLSSADWTNNYWGEPVTVETCPSTVSVDYCHAGNPRTHVSYGVMEPDDDPLYPAISLGPIESDYDAWRTYTSTSCAATGAPDGTYFRSEVCGGVSRHSLWSSAADRVDGSSPASTPFSVTGVVTVPPPMGVLTVKSLFGCTLCTRAAGQIADRYASTLGLPTPSAQVGDPVDTATGTLSETLTDVSLAGPGIPFAWTRSYNSRDTTSGRLGVGWVDAFDAHLDFDAGGNATYRAGDGSAFPFVLMPDGSFDARGYGGALKQDGTSYDLITPDQRTFVFNSSGQLTSIQPRNLPATTLAYTSGKLTSVTDSAGRTITVSYKTATPSLIDRVTLPDSRYVQFNYTSGRISSVVDLRGQTWSYSYDTNGYLSQIQDPLGHYPLRATYDAGGRVLTQTDGSGNVTSFSYSSAPDGEGYDTTTVSIPDRGNWVYRYSRYVLYSVTDPLGDTTTYQYDAAWRPSLITDPRGKFHSFLYDERGNLVWDTDANFNSIVRDYNGTNQLTSEQDRRGNDTSYSYCDASSCSAHSTTYVRGQLESVTDRAGGVRWFSYVHAGSGVPAATVGLTASETDERGKTTTYAYDSAGNLTSVTTPLGFVTTMTYDGSGRLQTQRDARGNIPTPPSGYLTTWSYGEGDQVASVVSPTSTTSYSYDDAGRLTQKTTPDGGWNYAYDNANRLTSTTDPASGVEHRSYDGAGGLVRLESAAGSVTTYSYDAAGRVATMREPLGNISGATTTDQSDHTWTYAYDAAGNLISKQHPDGGTQSITYDDVNQPTQWTDANSHTTSAAYDANYNLTSRTDAYSKSESYTYDALDRLHTRTDRNGKTTTLTYYATGQRASLTTALGNETTWTLDDDGRIASMVEPRGNATGASPSDYTWTYAYDAVGNTLTVTDPLGHATHRTYDAADAPTSFTDARGNTTDYAHDSMSRVTSVTPPAAGASSPLATTNTYDALGRLTTRTDPNGHTTSASYDADGQLTSAVTAATTTDYSYDANHNLVLQETRPTSGPSAQSQIAPSDLLSPPILDSFDRANEGPPLSPAWDAVVHPGDGGAAVSGDLATGTSGHWSALWYQPAAADQDVRVTLATPMGTGNSTYLYSRIENEDSSSVHGYVLTLAQDATSGSDAWAISRIDSSSSTTTLATNSTGAEATAGLQLRLVAQGSTLTGYALVSGAWVQQVQATDTTYAPSSALTGLGGDGASGAIDNFRSGSFIPSAPLLDDFNRSNQGPPPSGAWGGTVFAAEVGAQVTSNAARGDSEAEHWSQLWGQTLGPDQDIEVTTATPMGAGNSTRLYARVEHEGSASVSGYVLRLYQDSGTSGSDQWTIERLDGGAATTIATNNTGQVASAGMHMRFVARGAQLVGYALVNGVWTEQVQAADSTYAPALSRAGIGGAYSDGRLDDFRAGQLMPSAPLLDNFNRSNQGPPPSGSWGGTVFSGGVGAQVTSNAARGDSEASLWSQLWGQTLGPDQDVEFTTNVSMGSGNYTIAYARIEHEGTTSVSGYVLRLYQDSGTSTTDQWSIARLDSGAVTTLATNSTGQLAAAGLHLRFVLRGSQLIGYALVNGAWVEQVSATDTTYAPAASRVGLGGAFSDGRLDDFRASEIIHHAPLLDSFDRADSSPPLSGGWSGVVRTGDESAQVSDRAASGDGSSWSQLWAQTFGPDQEVEITTATPMGLGNYTHLYARITHPNSGDVTGYVLLLHQNAGSLSDEWSIRSIDDGAVNTLATNSTGEPAHAGLRMRFSVHGSTLTGYALIDGAWVEQVTTTDTSYHPAASQTGIGGGYDAGRLDDFRADGDATTSFAYDRMNRLTNVNYSDTTPDVTLSYDDAGRRQQMDDGAGSESYTYDNDNRLLSITRSGADSGTNGTISYAYDDAGNITSRTYPDTTSLAATYTNDEQLHTITSSAATTTFAYDPAGNLTTTTLPTANGYVETRAYDHAGRLTSIQNTSGATTLSHYALTLDESGDPTRIALTRATTTSYQALEYDARARLTAACYDITSTATNCSGASKQITYAYDKASNRTSQIRLGITNPGTTSYTYNDADQLTSTTTSSTTTPYTYDDRGNQTSDGTTTSQYNLADELTSARTGSSATTFTYDGDGKRLSSDASGGTQLRYSWDPLAPTEAPELALERSPSGTQIRDYITGPSGPLSLTTPAGTYYYHHDWQGSTSDITNASGTPQWAYDYEPYGTLRNATSLAGGAPANPLLYNGQYQDTQTATYNLRARQYDTASGRFLATDPLSQPPDAAATGTYLYAAGNPATLQDPLGLWPSWLDQTASYAEHKLSSGYNTLSDTVSATFTATTSATTTVASAAASTAGTIIGAGQSLAGYAADHPVQTIATGIMIVQPELAPGMIAIMTLANLHDCQTSGGPAAQGGCAAGAIAMSLVPGGGELAAFKRPGLDLAEETLGAACSQALSGYERKLGAASIKAAADGSLAPSRLVIGRTADLTAPGALGPEEFTLLDRLTPKLGSPRANWYRNSSVLRKALRSTTQVRDASPGNTAGQFLNAERNVLENRGWAFDPLTTLWKTSGDG